MRGVWLMMTVWTFAMLGSAVLGADAPGVAAPNESNTVPTIMTATASDGHLIRVQYYPLASQGVGEAPDVRPFNLTPDVLKWSLGNYEEFLAWRFDLTEKLAYTNVTIDEPSASAICNVACSTGFHVVISSQAPRMLRHYNDMTPDEYFEKVLGHELFHVVQRSANSHADGGLSVAEGTARFQETLHRYSNSLHAPVTSVYANDQQGCNGYDSYLAGTGVNQGNQAIVSDMELGMSLGPFSDSPPPIDRPLVMKDIPASLQPSHGYDTCYFWLSWYGHHGLDPFVRFIEGGKTVNDDSRFVEVSSAIESATLEPIVNDLARFAMMSLTGRGYEWRPAVGEGPVLDWGEYLDRWTPDTLMPGEADTVHIQEGGMMARQLGASGNLVFEGDLVEGFLVRDDGTSAEWASVESGSSVDIGSGETVWAVLIRPHADGTDATIELR